MSTSRDRVPKLGVLGFLGAVVLSTVSCSNIPDQPILAQNTPGINSPSGNTTLSPGSTNSVPSLSPLDQEFMTKMAQSNMIVNETSKLALQKSKNETVKKFAQQMILEYKGSSEQLAKIAKVKGFKIPEKMSSENQSVLTNLKQAPSDKFNRAYIDSQVKAHSKTQGEFNNYRKHGQDTNLKEFESKMSPVVAKHLKMAQEKARKF
jgi:putative membrane protein